MAAKLGWFTPILVLIIAAAIWLPTVHLLFKPKLDEYRQRDGISPVSRQLAARHLQLWENPARRTDEVARMRSSNEEWDFMGRTFLVLALTNMAILEPRQQPRYLAVVDAIVDETLRLEEEKGMYFFLMYYARRGQYQAQPARSTFLDGEIALMLAARQMVSRESRFDSELSRRINLLIQYMSQSPMLCGESYPDECWVFDNAAAIAAIRMSDGLDGRDHSGFINQWLAMAKEKLTDPKTGLLISSFKYDGRPMDGPEGSSIWMIAHFLQLVDPNFAAQQYQIARNEIGKQICGFGYAREWPKSWEGPADIDSGPIVPILGVSAGASGLAVVGAAAFGDDPFLQQLLTTLQFAAFPIHSESELRYAASNQVGDAVLLYAMVNGPLWQRVLNDQGGAK